MNKRAQLVAMGTDALSTDESVKFRFSKDENGEKSDRKTDLSKEIVNQFVEILGTDKIDQRVMRRSGALVYEILEDVLKPRIETRITDDPLLARIAEYKRIGWGEKQSFTIENTELLKVAVIASGTGNLIRQRLDSGYLDVPTEIVGLKIYENLKRLLAGKTDWASFVLKLEDSYMQDIYNNVYQALEGITAPDPLFIKNATYDQTVLDQLMSDVQSANNSDVVLVTGRKGAGYIAPTVADSSDSIKDELWKNGRLKDHLGADILVFKSSFVPGTFTSAINELIIYVVPVSDLDSLVKIMEEGDPIINEVTNMNGDMSKEKYFTQARGVAVVTSAIVGKYTVIPA